MHVGHNYFKYLNDFIDYSNVPKNVPKFKWFENYFKYPGFEMAWSLIVSEIAVIFINSKNTQDNCPNWKKEFQTYLLTHETAYLHPKQCPKNQPLLQYAYLYF